MPSLVEAVNTLAMMSGLRNPAWTEQSSYDGAPSSASDGVALNNAAAAFLDVALREQAHRRSIDIEVSTLDLTATYTITVDGTAVVYNAGTAAPADLAALVEGIKDAIEANGTVDALITVVVNSDNTLTLAGIGEADFLIELTTTGTAVMTATADAQTASWRLWKAAKPGTASTTTGAIVTGWRAVYGASGTVDYRGFSERCTTGGLSALYCELDPTGEDVANGSNVINYRAHVLIGPAVEE